MYARGFVAGNDGNISVRLGPDRILTTPTLVSKGFMTPGMLVLVDLDGRVVEGEQRPSSELKLHLRVYRERPDVAAVVHAHPAAATGFAVAGQPLDTAYMPELVINLGAVPVAEYATPGTDAVPDSIGAFVKDHNAVLMANHGVITWGRSLTEAFFRMETVESYAQILLAAATVGTARPLAADQREGLERIREHLGIRGVLPSIWAGPGDGGSAPGAGEASRPVTAGDLEAIIERVAERVISALKR
jgi:L-fuculose-phosphate aldolase